MKVRTYQVPRQEAIAKRVKRFTTSNAGFGGHRRGIYGVNRDEESGSEY